MNVAEIKSNIINEISSLDDILKLEKITKILGIGMPKKDIYVFSEEQQNRVNESIAQYESGNFMTDEEAEKDIQKWFDEQE
jgi:hypothetical protein